VIQDRAVVKSDQTKLHVIKSERTRLHSERYVEKRRADQDETENSFPTAFASDVYKRDCIRVVSNYQSRTRKRPARFLGDVLVDRDQRDNTIPVTGWNNIEFQQPQSWFVRWHGYELHGEESSDERIDSLCTVGLGGFWKVVCSVVHVRHGFLLVAYFERSKLRQRDHDRSWNR